MFAMLWEPASRVLVFRPMIRRGANPMTCLLASIGLYVAASESLRLCFGPETKRILPPAGSVVHLFSGVLTYVQCASVVAALICTFACVMLVKTTSAGRLWSAVRQDKGLSASFGINVERVRLTGCILGAGIMGLAGIFAGADTGVDVNIGINLLLMGIAVSILGGGRQPLQILICSVVVGLSRESIAWVLGAAWRDTIMFGAVALVICIRSYLKNSDCEQHNATSGWQ
jgi:urea transport system permease protein